jgi:hypothetical protein
MSQQTQTIRVGTQQIDEKGLADELVRVQNEIEAWGRQNELWHDESFDTPFLYYDEPPSCAPNCYS